MVVVFPGQGSQFPHMGKPFIANQEVMKYINQASEITGKDILHLVTQADDVILNQTENAQIALFVLNYALFKLVETQFSIQALAGHSLGEYVALACAGILSFEDACKLIIMRSKLMQQVSGKMVVVLNINAIEANMICSASSDIKQGDFCFVANYNSSTQIVLSGSENGIIKAQEFASKMNKKSMVLKVSGPFHSPYMKEAAQELAQTLSKITFNKPDMPVISNVYAHCDVNWEESVKLHMFMPVRWAESLKYISHTYANEPIYEIGASSILTNMAKRDGYNMMYFEKYENK